jgi:Domain of unknown function (DUF5655)/Domain of unknown function (DUF4287)
MAPKAVATGKKSIYSVHPGVAMVQKWIVDLPEKTGRSLEQWIKLIRKDGPEDEKACRVWLKESHKLGTNTAWWLAERARGNNTGIADEDPEQYLAAAEGWVDAMFTGPKAALRPIYDELLRLGFGLGKDVRVSPCQTIIPFYRQHVIAQVKPSTRTRIDFGFALGDTKATGRLIDTGGFAKKDRITHRIPIESLADIDAEVKRWLKVAYDMDEK